MRPALPFILFAATFCLGLGIVLPLVTIERLLVFTDNPSLVTMIAGLWREGDWLLAAIIALFSICFPCLKLALLHSAAYARDGAARVPDWARALSNWSMLDVVLVALVIFAAKTSGLATAFTQPGLWFFAASAVLTATATSIVKRRDAPEKP